MLLGASSCKLHDSESYQRSLPEAYDYPKASIHEVMLLPLGTTLINIEAFVTRVFVCPPNADCIGNSFTVVESLVPGPDQEFLSISILEPRQLILDQLYLLSLEASVDTTLQGTIYRHFELLAYSAVRN